MPCFCLLDSYVYIIVISFFALFLGIPLGNIITSGKVIPAIGYVSDIFGILTFIVALMILTVRFSRRH